MEDHAQDIGALQGKLEIYIEQQKEYREELKDTLEKMNTSINKIKTEFETYKTVARVFKYIGLSILALLTFKLGDFINLWHTIGEILNGHQ
jgi:chaperonin cofactor prefoldin